jgi:hypothetical protein
MMSALRQSTPREEEPGDIELSPDEAMAFFDREARLLVGMSGEEFLRRWDAGEFRPVPDETSEDRNLSSLVMALPLVGRAIS